MVKLRKTGRKAPPKVHAGESPLPADREAESELDDLGDATSDEGEPDVVESCAEPAPPEAEAPALEAEQGDLSGEAPVDGAGGPAGEPTTLLAESSAEGQGPESAATPDDAVEEVKGEGPEGHVQEHLSPEERPPGALSRIEQEGPEGAAPAGEGTAGGPPEGAAPAGEGTAGAVVAGAVQPADELVAGAAPREATPGVVLSDELPIDPDDDLRGVEGEASPRLVSILESLLYSAAKPLSVKDLRKVLQETSQHQIQLALRHLLEVTRSRGVVLAQVAGGFQFRTHPDNAMWVQKMLQAKPTRLSRMQIETLAIVAYRQPITRPEIDDIRGVDSGAVLKSLLERELIQIVGRKEEPGRPLLYGTTVRFLEFFNLRGLRDLPTLRDFRDLSEESKATLRQRLGDLQIAEALGQEVLGFLGSEEAGTKDMSEGPGRETLAAGATAEAEEPAVDAARSADGEPAAAVDEAAAEGTSASEGAAAGSEVVDETTPNDEVREESIAGLDPEREGGAADPGLIVMSDAALDAEARRHEPEAGFDEAAEKARDESEAGFDEATEKARDESEAGFDEAVEERGPENQMIDDAIPIADAGDESTTGLDEGAEERGPEDAVGVRGLIAAGDSDGDAGDPAAEPTAAADATDDVPDDLGSVERGAGDPDDADADMRDADPDIIPTAEDASTDPEPTAAEPTPSVDDGGEPNALDDGADD